MQGHPRTSNGRAVPGFFADSYLRERPFYETETSRKLERFESLVQVWSSYESRHHPDEDPFMSGVNGIQLLDDGARWWIIGIAWPRRAEVVDQTT